MGINAFNLVNMSSDLKTEIFAYHIFYDSWVEQRLKETERTNLQIYGDEYNKENSYLEACDNTFCIVFYIRILLFSPLYTGEIDVDKALNWRSLSDCYDHVTRVCDRNDFFGHLNIFERMFATCTYVLNLCLRIYKHSLIDVVNYGHIIWAMYFDKFTEKFYNEGGWNELKRVAKSYDSLYEFLGNFLHERLWSFKEASVNYRRFKMAVKYDNCKFKQKCTIHISKLWVKFHTEYFKEYVRIPVLFDEIADCFDIELLLQHLKLICNCSSEYDFEKDKVLQEQFQRALSFPEISYSKSFDEREETKTIDNECLSSRKDFEIPLQGVFSTPNEKIEVYELIDKNEMCRNCKNGSLARGSPGNRRDAVLEKQSCIRFNNLKDETMCPVIETNPKSSTKSTNLVQNKFTSFDSKNEKDIYSMTVKRQFDGLDVSNILSSRRNQKEEPKRSRKISPENLPNPTDLCSNHKVVESDDSRDSSRYPSDTNFSNKYEEVCNENNEITDVSSTNQTTANHCEGNAMQKNLGTPKDSFAGVEVTNNSDGKEVNTNKELDKLREEQNDPEIRKFLRMILVLGDRQGIQYVCGTLCSSQNGRENSQVRSNKGKKKSKKKSRK